jgi:hypothetical protein
MQLKIISKNRKRAKGCFSSSIYFPEKFSKPVHVYLIKKMKGKKITSMMFMRTADE